MVVVADQSSYILIHSCNVGVATPMFFMSNRLAENKQILTIAHHEGLGDVSFDHGKETFKGKISIK